MTLLAFVPAVHLDSTWRTWPSAGKGSPFVTGTAATAHPIPSKGFLQSAPGKLGIAVGAALCRHCRSRTSLRVARRDLLGAGAVWVCGAERALARSDTAPEIVKRLWAGGLSSGEDLDAWVAAFAADCVYEDLYYAQPATGRQELRGLSATRALIKCKSSTVALCHATW